MQMLLNNPLQRWIINTLGLGQNYDLTLASRALISSSSSSSSTPSATASSCCKMHTDISFTWCGGTHSKSKWRQQRAHLYARALCRWLHLFPSGSNWKLSSRLSGQFGEDLVNLFLSLFFYVFRIQCIVNSLIDKFLNNPSLQTWHNLSESQWMKIKILLYLSHRGHCPDNAKPYQKSPAEVCKVLNWVPIPFDIVMLTNLAMSQASSKYTFCFQGKTMIISNLSTYRWLYDQEVLTLFLSNLSQPGLHPHLDV